jgi:aconitate hydratase 2/2-methylisocitrate dehydratase
VVAPPTYNIVDELKAEGDWDILQKYAGFEFDDEIQKVLRVLSMTTFFI